ncbi:MAG: nucleotide exchange factor GrpE [Trueperaceae bacterium]
MSEFRDSERMVDADGRRAEGVDEGVDEGVVERAGGGAENRGENRAEAGDRGAASALGGASAANGDDPDEAEILRSELMRLQEELKEAKSHSEEMRDRFMRARADLENFRKRAAADAERARDAGLDSAVLPVLSVFDDLRRAIDAADSGDPASIVPGVQSVLSTLERNLEALGITPLGNVGDSFDPDLHEALTSVPTDKAEKSETIAEVFQLGFQKGDRLIRPARVVVYQS